MFLRGVEMDMKKFMEKNEGKIDRILRIIIGVVLLIVYAMGYVPGVLGYIVLLLAIGAMFTGVSGWCGLYALLGMSTKEKAGAGPQPRQRGKK
jgi:hypothetical protein